MENNALPDNIKKEVERVLGATIMSAESVSKIYGSDAHSFRIVAKSGKGTASYFLKREQTSRATRETDGTRFLESLLPVPRIIATGADTPAHSWLLFDNVEGDLMAEKYLAIKNQRDFDSFCDIEKEKERLLAALYAQPGIKLEYAAYTALPANELFGKRLTENRYADFFGDQKESVSKYFDRRIEINGHEFPATISEIFNSIRAKYAAPQNQKVVLALKGHGDAHHGNIIANGKIDFIDNEYAGYIPPLMELAKSYYNDFLGVFFFHYHETLHSHFNMRGFEDSGTKLRFKIEAPQKLSWPLELTRIKLASRSKWVAKDTDDFISMNDYLILCHALTKNPNKYPQETKFLFLAFLEIIAQFDAHDPESIYRYF